MNACTIIARNYLAYARVLATSYARHHPDERLSVLVIDGEVDDTAPPLAPDAEPFETILPAQLPLPADEFRKMAAIYDVMELATAVKPFFLRFLLARGADTVMFLDPDIQVFAPLDELGPLARAHAIVLIPHMLRPIPADGRKPTPADLAASGVYNLGFIALSPATPAFLDWWGERLSRDCLVAPEHELFLDQRLLDFLPTYFTPHIVRDPAYDVAYWNLHERRVTWTGERYEVAGAPLRFFHFSGFNPTIPHLLSKHQGATPRILLSAEPDLARLCQAYAQHLLAAGYPDCVGIPYGFARTADGVPFDRRMRRLYREALLAAERGEAPEPPSPFDAAEAKTFIEWLNSPAEDSMGPPRYLRRLYEERADLRAAFPDLSGPDLARYLDWVRADGRADPPVPAIFRADVPRGAWYRGDRAPAVSDTSEYGVNVVGYVRAELGTGEGARLTIAAVRAAGVPYSVIAYGDTSSRQHHPFNDFGPDRRAYDVNLVQVNADMFPRFAERYGRDLLDGRYTVGIWAWEVEPLPDDMAAAARYTDEIWAISEFTASVIAKSVSKPVFAFPLPVIPPTPPSLTRADLGLPDAFLFLFCFDFFSVMERKNPRRLIEAFSRAFAPHEGPVLVIKTINGDHDIGQLERLRSSATGRDDIRIIDGYLPQPHVHALMNSCDAYVSLHRGEGFGLTLAEAMALGKPVIATGYSGNLDFMNEGNSYLVPFQLEPIPPGCEPYPAGGRWAAPDVTEAARLMRYVYEHRDGARKLGQRAREDILRLHSPETRTAFIRSRLAAIRQARAGIAVRVVPTTLAPSLGSPETMRSSALLRAAGELAATAPPLGSRFAPIRFIQRALLRVLRPLLLHQRAFGEKLVEAAREIERTLDARQRERLDAASRELADALARAAAETRAQIRAELKPLVNAVDQLREPSPHRDLGLTKLQELVMGLQTLSAGTAEQVGRLLAELHATAHVWDPSLLSVTRDAWGRPTIGYRAAAGGPTTAPYLGFEEIFRGPEAIVRDRQRPYVEMLRGRDPIVDVGCGRGELLDLCRDAGLSVRGVDVDPGMVARCRAKGHDVERADALEYLARQGDESIGAVFSAQLIEHLPHEQLIRFLQLSYRKLAADGLFVAETVNPHSIQAFKAFWTDLTHQRPIFPETLLALCRLYGFEEASIFFPMGSGDIDADRWNQGDYAVVAKRGVAASSVER
jgi:glycosyltransferase involved in cell wall biosynthesis